MSDKFRTLQKCLTFRIIVVVKNVLHAIKQNFRFTVALYSIICVLIKCFKTKYSTPIGNVFDAIFCKVFSTLFIPYCMGTPCRLSGFPVRTQSGRGSTQLRSNPGPFRAHVSLKLGLKVESYFHTNISRKFHEFVRICEL